MPYTALKGMILNTVSSFYSSTGELNNGVLCELDQVTFKKNVITRIQINGIQYCLGSCLWFQSGSQFLVYIIKEIQVRGDRKFFITTQLQSVACDEIRGFFSGIEDITIPLTPISPEYIPFPWPAFYFKEAGNIYIVPPALPC